MRGRGQSSFKIVDVIIHSKICYLWLTKEIQFLFVRPSKLRLRIIFHKFSSFLRLRYSYDIHFLGNFYLKLNQLKSGILLMNTNKVARACSKSFFQ